jgi:predicted ATP-dependent endonuclease of OLD family
MKIKNVHITNYKSLKDINIPFNSYGSRSNKSNSIFLVGINESGKSAILNALSLIKKGLDEVNYEEDCYLESQESNEYIQILVDFDDFNINLWKKTIIEKIGLPENFVKNIKFLKVQKHLYINNEYWDSDFIIEINDELPFYQFVIETSQKTVNNKVVSTEAIKKLIENNSEITEKEITKENAESYLLDKQKILTREILQELISTKLMSVFEANIPKIQIWKPSPEYLINDTISLEGFKENTSISIPLRNIFNVYGLKTDDEIKTTIERALKNQARRDELQNKISAIITRHINKIWKEHKIKIRVSINGSDCQVHVEDNDKEFTYYTMNQRSDGFKQFISLILSLSAQNVCNNLKDNVILIDEPEVHLHPSGVRYMRDEILKIGKNNFVFVATHSHYMVDTTCPERHWIVTKNEIKTSLRQIDENTPVEDDAVLASAFGLNLFKELLPKNILIVEGVDDKSVISHTFQKLNSKVFHSIKTAKGASKAYSIASLLSEEEIPAFFIFDDDKEGADYKKKIIENFSNCFNENNVFTIRDVCGTLPNKCTLEDLMPTEFVRSFFESELDTNLTLVDNLPVLKQITDQVRSLRENKQKLDSLKVKLSVKFINDFNSKQKLTTNSQRIVSFINDLSTKIDSYEHSNS